jgi:autotransporter-associated beta strand protein
LWDTTSFTVAAPFSINGTVTLNGDGANVPGVTGDSHILGTTTGSGAYLHTLDEAGSAVAGFNSPINLTGTSRFTLTGLTRAPTDTLTDTFLQPISGVGGIIKDGEGTMILAAVNTYTGPTTVTNGKLSVVSPGTIATTPSITVQTNGTFDVSGATGFTIGGTTAQTLQGTGTVVGALTVTSNGTVRGDSGTGTGTLTLGSSTTVNSGGTVATNLTTTGTTISANSKLAVGGNTLNLVSSGGKFNIALLNDAGLQSGTAYTITLATASAASSYQRNGTAWSAGGNPYAATDFNLVSGSGTWSSFSGVTMGVDAGNNLVLAFTPVPEPMTLLLGSALVGGGLAWRRNRRRTAAV